MELRLDVCTFVANQAGIEKPWRDLLSHADSTTVEVYVDRVAVRMTVGRESRILEIERNGQGDYKILHYGDLKHPNKSLLRLFGADKKVLCQIGERFINFYRSHPNPDLIKSFNIDYLKTSQPA